MDQYDRGKTLPKVDIGRDIAWYESDKYKESLNNCCEGLDALHRFSIDDLDITFVFYTNDENIDKSKPNTLYLHDNDSHKGILFGVDNE